MCLLWNLWVLFLYGNIAWHVQIYLSPELYN